MKPILKNKEKTLKKALIALLATNVILAGVVFYAKSNNINLNAFEHIKSYLKTKKQEGSQLTPNNEVQKQAEFLNIDNMLTNENGQFIRYEALTNSPIYLVVDEESIWSMTDANKNAIKQSAENYNKIFQTINPDYKFQYISKNEFDIMPQKEKFRFIFITSQLKIQNVNGSARAASSPMKSYDSKYGNGKVSIGSTIVLSSTGLISLNEEEITSIIMHEIAHTLGIEEHSSDEDSMMNPIGAGKPIMSDIASEDILKCLYALYYNPETNKYSPNEVLDFINNSEKERQEEINNRMEEIKNEQEPSK